MLGSVEEDSAENLIDGADGEQSSSLWQGSQEYSAWQGIVLCW